MSARFYQELSEWWPLFSPPEHYFEGLFPRATWLETFDAAGLSAKSDLDVWGRDVFIARKR